METSLASEEYHAGEKVSHYAIVKTIGTGGMGTVFLARDLILDRLVAIKILLAESNSDPERKRRFLQEAKTASSLNHPNIVTIYEIGSAGSRDFIAMEYMAGRTIKQCAGETGLPLQDALRYAVQIAEGLAAAHAAHVVHRDLKPSNIMVTDRGAVKILDFGLAKLIRTDLGDATRTQATDPGVISGTPAYMSPEQCKGLDVDWRSDIFSFGVVLYEMVAGRPPFKSGNLATSLVSILTETPVPLSSLVPDIPADLEKIVVECLHKDREARTLTAEEIRIALERMMHASIMGQTLPSYLGVAAMRPPRKSKWLIAALAITAAGLISAGLWWWRNHVPAETGPWVLKKITTDAGLSAYPALSPDGKLLAYASDRAHGNLDIWVQHVSGGEPVNLTKDTADDYEPSFSPDGTQIASRSEREQGGLYMMSALGGAARLVSREGYSPVFSPDGKWITYWTGFVGPNFLPGSTKVYIRSLSNGAVKQIAPEFWAVRRAIWMRDGRHLLFVGRLDTPDSLDWWVASMDGGKPIRTGVFAALRQRGLSYPLLEYAFIPESLAADSKHILFSAKLGDSTNVWQIALTPDKYQVEGPPVQLTSGTGLELQATSVAGPAGKPIFIFASLARTVDVWSLPIHADEGKVTGELQPLTRASSFNAWPNLSADGTKLVYVAYDSDKGTVWFRDLKKADAIALNITLSGEIQPKLSPDGLRIAYGDEKNKIGYVAEVQGVAVEKVCDKCSVPTAWSRDGRTLVFESGGGQYSVVIIDLATKRRIERSSRLHQMINATRLSPDGHWASLHMRNTPITRRIFVARFQDGTIADEDTWIPITDGSAMDRETSWSPSGNVLYFLSERDGHRCIWAQRLDPQSKRPVGSAFPVLHLHGSRESIAEVGPNVGAVGLSVAADKLAFAMGTLSGNLWMREFTGP